MEIEINSKKNNPLLNRTEVYFTIYHENERTTDRGIVKTELADKLNVKKENIVVSNIDTSFGVQRCTGYAKIYSSTDKAKFWEKDYILKRNKIIGKTDEKEEKPSEGAAAETKPAEEPPAEEPKKEEEQPKEESVEPVKEESDEAKQENQDEQPPAEDKGE